MSSPSGFSGFFTKRAYSEPKPRTIRRTAVINKVLTCEDCGLYKSNMIVPLPRIANYLDGFDKCDVLIVFDYPSESLLSTGQPNLVERFYDDLFRQAGVRYLSTYVTQCNRSQVVKGKESTAIQACYTHLQAIIHKVQPIHIVSVGTNASKVILGEWVSTKTAGVIAGSSFPYHPGGYWVYPMLDTTPSVLKVPRLKNLITKDFQQIDFTKPAPVKVDFGKNVSIITDYKQVCSLLDSLVDSDGDLVFDYETTRIRPQGVGAKIVTVSLALVYEDDSYEGTWVVPLENPHFFTDEQQKDVMTRWANVLKSSAPKVAQNITFEDIWSRVRAGVKISNWKWCTENGEHIIDERTGICGLKYQGTRYYGVFGYDDEIEKYTKSADSQGVNKVLQAPQDELMLYCGIDVEITLRRYVSQRRIINSSEALRDCMNLFMNGLRCFCNLHERGLPIDIKYFEDAKKKLDEECDELQRKILTNPDVVAYSRQTRRKFNQGSLPILRDFFFNFLGMTSLRKTGAGVDAVDKQFLEVIDHPVARDILRLRGLQKISGTYIEQFLREQENGMLHPTFNLHTTRTGRSSSTNPNFQNIPKRNEQASRICRMGVRTPPGFRMMECDYCGVETKMAGAYTCDPVLLKYLNDTSTDMHYDFSEQVFCASRSDISKPIRSLTKNSATFPWFYGSYYVSIAKNIWEHVLYDDLKLNDGKSLKEHLFNTKVSVVNPKTGNKIQIQLNTLDNYILYLKGVESNFWNKFKVFKKWQENEIKVYETELETENFFGFTRRRDLSNNEIINTPFQGTAFQCLLWSIYHVDKKLVEGKFKSYVVGQIHDAIVGYVHPSEEQEVFTLIQTTMRDELMAEYSWINVPLDIEIDVSEIDGSWYEMSPWVQTNGVWHKKGK